MVVELSNVVGDPPLLQRVLRILQKVLFIDRSADDVSNDKSVHGVLRLQGAGPIEGAFEVTVALFDPRGRDEGAFFRRESGSGELIDPLRVMDGAAEEPFLQLIGGEVDHKLPCSLDEGERIGGVHELEHKLRLAAGA